MTKKYQIFISSTYKDLKQARIKVRDAILSMYHFPVGMEMFDASNKNQWDIIKNDIDGSDYYVLIIGKCFGSIVPNEDISYTQKEFRYALEKGVPILAFIMDEDAETAPTFKEVDFYRIQKLEEFKEEVKRGRTVSYWNNVDELVGKVILSLTKEIARNPQLGWVRYKENPNQENKISNETRKPNLFIKLLDSVQIPVYKIPYIENPYKPIDIELVNDDKKQLAVNYNKSLPSKKKQQEYINDVHLRDLIFKSHTGLDFFIENNGTLPASEIDIEIEIPEKLKVFDSLDLGMLTTVNPLKTKKNPLSKKVKKLEGVFERNDYPECFRGVDDINGWDIKGNKISILCHNIRHGRKVKCDKFFMVTEIPGEYQLKFKISCAELADPIEQVITIKAVKME